MIEVASRVEHAWQVSEGG